MKIGTIIFSIILIAISITTLYSLNRNSEDSNSRENFLIIGEKEYPPFQMAFLSTNYNNPADYVAFIEFVYIDDESQEFVGMFCQICSESEDITKPGSYNGVEWEAATPAADPLPLSPEEAALFPKGYVKYKPSPNPTPITNTFDISASGLVGLSAGKLDFFKSGAITITKSMAEYCISFDCILENGEKVIGNYTGKLHEKQNKPDKSSQPVILDQFIIAPPQ